MRKIAIGLACSLVACSSSSNNSGSHDSGAADTGGLDASMGMGDSASDGPAASLPQMLLSSGNFNDVAVDGGTPGANLVLRDYDVPPSARCGVVRSGTCWIQDCRVGDAGTAQPPTVSAGMVTLSQGSTTLITATQTGGGVYSGSTTSSWSAGAMLTFVVTGATLPAFTQTLTAPPTIAITSPFNPDGGVVSLTGSSDLTVTWQSTSASNVVVGLEETSGTSDLHIVCEFPGAAGTGTVPASVVGMLDKGLPSNQVALNIGGEALADTVAGSYPVHVYLVNATTQQVVVQ